MEEYVRVEIKTTEFDTEDVITTSNARFEEYEIQRIVKSIKSPSSSGSSWW